MDWSAKRTCGVWCTCVSNILKISKVSLISWSPPALAHKISHISYSLKRFKWGTVKFCSSEVAAVVYSQSIVQCCLMLIQWLIVYAFGAVQVRYDSSSTILSLLLTWVHWPVWSTLTVLKYYSQQACQENNLLVWPITHTHTKKNTAFWRIFSIDFVYNILQVLYNYNFPLVCTGEW